MSATAHAAPAPSSSASASAGSSGGHGSTTPAYLNTPYRAYQLWQRAEYPKQVWYFVGAGLGALVLCNLFYILRVRLRKGKLMENRHITTGDNEKHTGVGRGPASWRRLPLAIDSAFKIVAFRWTVPYGLNYVLSLSEVFFTVGYLTALMIWTFIYSYGGQEAFWTQRAGAIAYWQFPLLPLLAGKNNFITFVTGISYEKINIMHRAVARTLFILVLLHAFTKAETFTADKLAAQNYLTGTMAAVAIGAIFLTSLRPVRTHAFELFLILHICLIAIFLAGLYFHQPKNALFIWLFIGFWGFDRVTRGLRLFFINRGMPKAHDAIVEAISTDSVRLVLPNRHITWKAGQHVFLILPGVSNIPFEAHPFTIANIPDRDGKGKKKVTDLVFYIRAMDGFTRKLHDYAAAHQGSTVSAFVDGPYGVPPPVNTFTTVVLIAGGSGASFTVPLLLDIISAARHQKTPVKRVMFIWSVKNSADLKWASEVITSAANNVPGTLDLDLRIHVTGAGGLVPTLGHGSEERMPITPTSPVEKSGSTKGSHAEIAHIEEVSTQGGHSTLTRDTSVYKTRFGRPNIPAMIREEIEASTGPVSVNACGPSRLTKAVRATLRSGPAGPSAVLRGTAPVSMYIENFGAVRSSK
ncbi:hypothetical protein M408DRAFT_315075 [Serendipita vermifera MAFF 305830]|uniref:ferric-chelate reductase (NADPH) n=1 Tax=Serendipita vermifera MAFF 305830 TaxID=933852 RepID=A0A0C3ALQ8_SERVB|nr:hypothetical protein M408DRAFT_315075 [Serendipita vermifera MAFF 305830]